MRSHRLIATIALGLIGAAFFALPSAAEQSGGVPGPSRVMAQLLDSGHGHTCAQVTTGPLRCWGSNARGNLGQGHGHDIGDSVGESTVSVDLGAGRRAIAVSLGGFNSCAIDDLGAVRCWGAGDRGQLAQGNTADVGDSAGETTVEVTLGQPAKSVSVGNFHACAIVEDGSVRCWGANYSGQLAQGTTEAIGDEPGETPPPVDLGAGVRATSLAAGADFTCAITDLGAVRCWGVNGSGVVVNGTAGGAIGDLPGESPSVIELGPGRTATALAVGHGHACVITDLGEVRCWGRNEAGQLGQGHTDAIGDQPGEGPVAVDLGAGRTAVAVSASFSNTCAITDLGELRCWGANLDGQLGQGDRDPIGDSGSETTGAIDLGTGRKATAVTMGTYHVCAATGDGAIRCWGRNDSGQLGRGNNDSYGTLPGQIPAALTSINLGGAPIGPHLPTDTPTTTAPTTGPSTSPTTTGPTTTGPTTTGPAPTPSPSSSPSPSPASPTSTPTHSPTTPAEVTLLGKTLRIKAFVRRQAVKLGCPIKAKVIVKVGRKIKAKTRLKTFAKTKQGAKAKKVKGCQVRGRIRLAKKPPRNAKVKVIIRGRNLKTKTIRAVRVVRAVRAVRAEVPRRSEPTTVR